MYILKVTLQMKQLITDTADACSISTASVMRKVAVWVEKGRISFTAARDEAVIRRGDKCTATLQVPEIMLKVGKSIIKSDMERPTVKDADFRLALAAACMDTMATIHSDRMRERYAGLTGDKIREAAEAVR